MTRQEALEFYKMVKEPGDIKALLSGDLFYLMLAGLGRTDINQDFLYDRCREVQARPDGYLDLWAREHYKSTIITVGKTIQDILNNPDITVGIFSHTRPIAKSFLKQIKRELEANALLHEFFPHVCPPNGGERRTWSEDEGITVIRSSNPKEATVEAWGLVDGQPTGKHFSILIYDDVVTRESVTTPDQIKKTTEAWELSLNLGTKGGRRRMIGTRYHHFDTWQEIIKRGSAIPRIYPATHNGAIDGNPIFLSAQELADKRKDMGPYIFSAQMLQNPTADEAQSFKEQWLLYYLNNRLATSNYYLICDPASAKKKDSDYTVMLVLALGADSNIYLVDGLRDRLNLTERCTELFRLHRKYTPLFVGYEQYGMQADIEHVKYVQEQENYRFVITEIGGQMPKVDRIRRLVPAFEQGRIYLPSELRLRGADGVSYDLVKEFISDEYTTFPVCAHDDMLDCLSRIFDLPMRFPRNVQRKPVDKYADTEHNLFDW